MTGRSGLGRRRQPSGVPAGGQFASSTHDESNVTLGGAAPSLEPDLTSKSRRRLMDRMIDPFSRDQTLSRNRAEMLAVVEAHRKANDVAVDVSAVTSLGFEKRRVKRETPVGESWWSRDLPPSVSYVYEGACDVDVPGGRETLPYTQRYVVRSVYTFQNEGPGRGELQEIRVTVGLPGQALDDGMEPSAVFHDMPRG